MPTDVKLNAEGVEAARAVLVEGRDNFATFEQHAAGIVRAYLAALDNSKPTPAGDDGLIARLNAACISNPYALIPWPRGLLHKAASALAAAHSQHEADVARIGELERQVASAAGQIQVLSEKYEQWMDRAAVAEAALAGVKP